MNVEVPDYAVQDEVGVDPAKTALVIIDMQNDFVKQGGSLLVPEAEATVPAIKCLLDFARANQMRVVFSQDTHRKGDPEWEIWPEHCREGSWGWEIVAELRAHCPRHGPSQAPLRRVLRNAARPLAPAVAGPYPSDLRDGRQYLGALHGGERRAALVCRGDPARRDLGAQPFDLEASLRQTVFVCSGQLTTADRVRLL